MHFTFHVTALPHTQTTKSHNACAYTMKVWNFCKMMMNLGHTVYHYGCESSNPPCTEHINIITLAEQKKLFPQNDWHKEFYNIEWDSNKPYWKLANNRSIEEIKKRSKKDDFLCIIGGTCQKPIADAFPKDIKTVEFGVGYQGVFAFFKIFESYAHQAKIYGNTAIDPDGHFYDAVIPNYFDVTEFPFCPIKKDYYLYIGRLIKRKGIQIAIDTCNTIQAKLIIAGQGIDHFKNGTNGYIKCTDGGYYEANLEYIGFADIIKRAQLMGEAKAVFVPTLYLGPFEGVNVESQLCGTPVITTDWGVFPETVEHGKTGYRCRTHEQFCWAAKNLDKLASPQYIRDRAVYNYSLEKVALMYQEFFYLVNNLSKKGYYEENNERTELNWLIKK